MTNQIYLNGSGVAAGDVDGDGWCDLYYCGLDGPNVLYRNLGNWKFQDITDSAGVACANLDASGAAFADVDGDGDLDLVVNSVAGGTHLFSNDGKGRFSALSPPLNLNREGMSLALADIDGDGDLDLYVTNYRVVTVRDQPNTKYRIKEENGKYVVLRVNDRPVTEPDLVGRFSAEFGRVIENGEVDALFRNEGNGKFIPIPFTDGTFLDEEGNPLKTSPYEWGLSVMFRDINGDRLPDLYVCNDFSSPDRIWINTGKGQFRAIPRLALRSTSLFSMGVDFADLNRDGFDEIFVADMLSRDHVKRQIQVGDIGPTYLKVGQVDNRPQYSRNTLFLNRGDGTYAEIGQFSRVEASEWSWTPIFLDGDLDVVVNNLQAPAGLYRNESSAPRVAVRLSGLAPNTQGIGAKIQLLGGPVSQSQEVICAGRYLSADDPLRVFAAGALTNDLSLVVTWRSGKRSLVKEVQANRLYEIQEAQATAGQPSKSPAQAQPLFQEVSQLLG